MFPSVGKMLTCPYIFYNFLFFSVHDFAGFDMIGSYVHSTKPNLCLVHEPTGFNEASDHSHDSWATAPINFESSSVC